MKKNTAYTIGSLIILLICAFVFVILPVFTGGAGAAQGETPVFGKYNGKEIRYEKGSDFSEYVQQYGQMFQQYGQQIDSSTYYYIFNYAFNSTVLKYAYADAAVKAGYKVSEAALKRGMLPYFYDETGKYSDKLYREVPEADKLAVQNSVESQLIAQRFYDDTFGSQTEIFGTDALYGLKESNKEMDFLMNYGKSKRGFKMAVFPLKDFPESEKVKYGKQNSAKFISYDLSVITVEDKATANKVSKRIANGEITFEDAVSEYSLKNYSNSEGKITNKLQYQIENILSDKSDLAKITDLSVGGVSEAVQTNSGYSIFKLDANKVQPDFEIPETLTQLSNYLSNYETTIIEDYFTAKATDFKNEVMKSDFDKACTKLNVSNVDIAPFPLNYGSVDLTTSVDTSLQGLAGADTNETFLKTAFALKLNELSAPIVMDDNVIVLQYTSEEAATEENAPSIDLESYDTESARNYIMNSDKLENNFASVYFNNFMN